jgi:histidyl-tRNA synthetase
MFEQIPDSNETLAEGKAELLALFENVPAAGTVTDVAIVFDPAIARGLDYYTGMVCETTIDGLERYGSVCSGGRYADLASRFTSRKLPGVGLSIGLSRLMAIIKEESLLDFSVQTKTQIVVGLFHESLRSISYVAAEQLRTAGVRVETVYKEQSNLGKQIEQAKGKGVAFVLACEQDGSFSLFPTAGGDKQVCHSIEEVAAVITTQ